MAALLTLENDFSEAEAETDADTLFVSEESYESLKFFVRRQKKLSSKEEELALFERWFKKGDEVARTRLVNSQIRFAFKLAMGYRGYDIPVEELTGKAVECLIEAVDRFNPAKETRFSSFVGYYVGGQLKTFILDQYEVPRHSPYNSIFFKLRSYKKEERDKDPSLSDHQLNLRACQFFSEKLKVKVTLDHIREVENAFHNKALSLNSPASDDDSGYTELIDLMPSMDMNPEALLEARQESQLRSAFISAAFEGLTQTQRELIEILDLSDNDQETRQIAIEKMGLTPEQREELYSSAKIHFKNVAQRWKSGRLNLTPHSTVLPPALDDPLHDPALETVRTIAKSLLTSREYFIFSSIHLATPFDGIALADIATALNRTVPETRSLLSFATEKVLDRASANGVASNVIQKMKDNLLINEGRSLENYPFVETKLDLPTNEDREIYKTAWELFDQKLIDEKNLYIFLTYRAYNARDRKTTTRLSEEMGLSQAAIHARLLSVTKTVRDHVRLISVTGTGSDYLKNFSTTEAVRDHVHHELTDHDFFDRNPLKSVTSTRAVLQKGKIPEIDTDLLDLDTPEKQLVYQAARGVLTPYRLYTLCMNCLAKEDYRMTAQEIADQIQQTRGSVSQSIKDAKTAVVSVLPEGLKATPVLKQTPSKIGKATAASINVPEFDPSLISYKNDDTSEILNISRKVLTPIKLYAFVVHRLYFEADRLTKEAIAEKILTCNSKQIEPALLKDMAGKVSAALSAGKRELRNSLPDRLKDSPVLEQTPARSKKVSAGMEYVPEVRRLAMDLSSPSRIRVLETATRELNALQLYTFCMTKMARPAHRLTIQEVAERVDKKPEYVSKNLSQAIHIIKEKIDPVVYQAFETGQTVSVLKQKAPQP